MSLRKLLTKITLRYFFKRNKFFAPLIVFGCAISFARWLIKKEKKSDSSIERLEKGETLSVSHLDPEDLQEDE